MTWIGKIIFFLLLTSIFFFEGFGMRNGRETAYFIVLFTPLILFAIDYLQKKPIVIPKKMGLLLLVYLGLLFVSTYFSVQVQKSFEQTLFYIAVFFIFIYVNNHKDELKKPIFIFILLSGAILSLWALFLRYVPDYLRFLIPRRDYQYVFPIGFIGGGTHTAVSSFLVVVMILLQSLYLKIDKRRYLLLSLIFVPIFLFTYSKAAYVVMIIFWLYFIYQVLKNKKQNRIFITTVSLVAIVVTSIFILFTTKIYLPIRALESIKTTLQNKFRLIERPALSWRNKFVIDAITETKKRPMFGVGPGNYIFISNKYKTTLEERNDTAHNILFDNFSEHGIPAGLVFIFIIYLIIKSGRAHKKTDLSQEYCITFVFLIILFQGDYIHRFYSFYLFFWIVAGLVYEEKTTSLVNKKILLIVPLLFVVVAVLIITSNKLYSQKKYIEAFLFYPLNKKLYIPMIWPCVGTNKINCQKGYIKYYTRTFSADAAMRSYFGYWYLNNHKPRYALFEFEKAYEWAPLTIGKISNIYRLKKKFKGQKDANLFATTHFNRINKMFIFPLNELNIKRYSSLYFYRARSLFKEARLLCQKIYNKKCPYKF